MNQQQFTRAAVLGGALMISLAANAQDITTGLVAHWKLDEGFNSTTAADSVGGFDGTVQGGVTTGLTARVDNGFLFSGTAGNKVETTATATSLGMNSGPFSMFVFIKTPPIGTDLQRHIISANDGTANRWNLHVLDGSGNLQWFHNGGVGINTGQKVDDDQWHLVGMSRDADNNYTWYVDSNSATYNTSAAHLLDANITIGGRPGTFTNFFFNGLIDDVRFYNRVLSSNDILALLAQPFPAPGDPIWLTNASGSWHDGSNWSSTIPNSNTAVARLSSVITAPRTVAVDLPTMVKQLDFDADSSYVVGGTATFTFDADAGSAAVNVLQGGHQFQAAVSLADDLNATVSAGATLDFNNALRLNGNTVTKNGDGRININNLVHSGGGTVNVAAGTLGGNGAVGGNVNNQAGGRVAPGTSVGILDVAGNYAQSAGATLEIELAGPSDGEFDILNVSGTATLAGALDISRLEGFSATSGQAFEILTAANVVNSGLTLTGDSSSFELVFNATSVLLSFTGSTSLPGDFNGDGKVDAADYTVWRDGLGSEFTQADYTVWKNNFGAVAGSGSSVQATAVPEPATGLLMVLTGVSLMIVVRRSS